jgi:hypothetical protein
VQRIKRGCRLDPSWAVLLQFRDAVKAKYADSLLRGVAPASILVYKDRSTFDGNEEPLEEDTLLDGLGKTMKDALIVIYSGSSFPRSRVLFYNSISDVDENDGWISFDHMIPFISLNKMYIRNCYRTIASSIIKPGINKAIITGTPGIGKSIFLIYLLWKLVKEGKGFSSFIIHSTFTMMEKVEFFGFPMVDGLRMVTIRFGMIRSGACLTRNSKTKLI